ncbi:MAG: hypothetical protein LBE36_01830 [Flavobacteriaceae bacterium]|nr:hypothetical protein [Flavobacteriaceae bacterium]
MNRKQIKKFVMASAASLVVLLNCLAPNLSMAKNIAYAKVSEGNGPSNGQPQNAQIVPALVVIAVIFAVVAVVKKGGAQLTNDTDVNLSNLD